MFIFCIFPFPNRFLSVESSTIFFLCWIIRHPNSLCVFTKGMMEKNWVCIRNVRFCLELQMVFCCLSFLVFIIVCLASRCSTKIQPKYLQFLFLIRIASLFSWLLIFFSFLDKFRSHLARHQFISSFLHFKGSFYRGKLTFDSIVCGSKLFFYYFMKVPPLLIQLLVNVRMMMENNN